VTEGKQREKALKSTNSDLEKINVESQAETERVNAVNQQLTADNQQLRDQMAVHEEEEKEAQIKISELEDEIKGLKMRTLNTANFRKWDHHEILFWIMTLNGGMFMKYEAVLTEALSKVGMKGENLVQVAQAPFMIGYWGMDNKKDEEVLIRHIQELVQQNQPGHHGAAMMAAAAAPKEDEGAVPTAFVG